MIAQRPVNARPAIERTTAADGSRSVGTFSAVITAPVADPNGGPLGLTANGGAADPRAFGRTGSNLTVQLARLGALSLILGLFMTRRRKENEPQLITE